MRGEHQRRPCLLDPGLVGGDLVSSGNGALDTGNELWMSSVEVRNFEESLAKGLPFREAGFETREGLDTELKEKPVLDDGTKEVAGQRGNV